MRFKVSLLFILFSVQLFADESDFSEVQYQVVKDLRSEFLVYDPDFSSYVPYNSEIHRGTKYITLPIDSSFIKRYPLVIYLKAGSSIFLDNKLLVNNLADKWMALKYRQVKKSRWITIYNSAGQLPLDKVFFGFSQRISKPEKQLINKLELRPTFPAVFQNFFILVFLAILCLLAVSKIFNGKAYSEFYSLAKNTLAISKDQSFVYKKPLNSNNLLSIFIHSLIFVFVFFIVQYFTHGLIQLPLLDENDSLIQLLVKYLIASLLVFLIYILKYILIAFISYLYNLKEYRLAHYFNFVKLSMLFYLIILPVSSIVYLWNEQVNDFFLVNIVSFIILGFSIVKIFIITYNLNKIRQFRNLYLFSYLCATEIIPLFIVFKLLV